MRKTLPIFLIIPALLVSACGDDNAKTSSTRAAVEKTTDTGCEVVSEPKAKTVDLAKPSEKLDPKKTYAAVVDTSCGGFEIKLDVKKAPKTSASFVYLAQKGVFDGLGFHRVAPGFVIQGGDPNGDGSGDAGYKIVENPSESQTYTRGVVAMAKGGTEKPGTSGSQFFVVTGEDAQLPPDYALLGKVTEGLDTVDKIGTSAVNPPQDGKPYDPIAINKVTIEEN